MVVSGAAGAVGTVVGQIAKIKGCTVVGIAGGAEKCDYIVNDLGFDAAIDYKSEDVRKALQKHCPKGIDAISTTSAEKSWTLRSRSLRAAHAWSSAARSRSTAIPHQSKDLPTTFRFSSIAPA